MFLDDGDPQTVSFSVCCKWSRWAVLPLNETLEAEIFRDKDMKRWAVYGGVFVPKSNRGKYCPDCAGCGKIITSELETVIYPQMVKKLASYKPLKVRKKEAKANLKIAVLQVEPAHVNARLKSWWTA